ncbi:hypothetical protein M9H77_29539 [Catharanthus roseus]|uniref:Uncharacterized protein n=1 Tax=Catharanthus roseus TaxID=4058 RepID=A0ACB9ZXB1_CATRO|nr:hypothetical protein M9H77_29539 [Catharanthus roseus]
MSLQALSRFSRQHRTLPVDNTDIEVFVPSLFLAPRPTADGRLAYLRWSVFDVSKGKSHYGAGGGYNHFAGRDASLAFVSGNFTDFRTFVYGFGHGVKKSILPVKEAAEELLKPSVLALDIAETKVEKCGQNLERIDFSKEMRHRAFCRHELEDIWMLDATINAGSLWKEGPQVTLDCACALEY